MKKILSMLLAAVLILCGAVPVSAEDGNIIYSGNAGKFIFEPGTEYSPTDLFPDLKDVMPGDVLTQRIVLRNDASRQVGIRVLMRSLGAHPDCVEFLSQMKLTVVQVTKTELFEAPADQSAQLTDWVELGWLRSGGTVELEITLEVPTTMGNEFQEQIGYLDWQFMVEEFPAAILPLPQTGDDMNFPLYVGLMGGALVAIVVVVILMARRKKKDEEK